MVTDKSFAEIEEELKKPFRPEMVSWTPTYVNTDRMFAYVYPNIDRYAVSKRLDDVLGAENWEHSLETHQFQNGKPLPAFVSKLTLSYGDDEEVSKEDGSGIGSGQDAVKGGITQSLKRVADLFGIGRYLRKEDAYYVDLSDDRNEHERTLVNDGNTYSFDPPYDQCSDSFFPEGQRPSGNSSSNRKPTSSNSGNDGSLNDNDFNPLDSDGNLTFGQHEGDPLSSPDDGYIDYMLGEQGFDKDTKKYEVFENERKMRLKDKWKSVANTAEKNSISKQDLVAAVQEEFDVEKASEMTLSEMSDLQDVIDGIDGGDEPRYDDDGILILSTPVMSGEDATDPDAFFEG